MRVGAEVDVAAPKHVVWNIITNIDEAQHTITAIEKIEVLERPPQGLLGLKWRETRTMFGKTAIEVMTVTEVEEGTHYCTEAESHGSAYFSKLSVAEVGDATRLTMTFRGEAQSFGAKVMSAVLGPLFKGATEKAMRQDLLDIKAKAEASG